MGWELIKSIIQQVRGHSLVTKKEVYEKITPGQKSLFSFWVLHGHTRSGWLQFYLEEYAQYIPVIRYGLEIIDDQAMLANLHEAKNLYSEILEFLNSIQNSPKKIENYIRANPDEFVMFTK